MADEFLDLFTQLFYSTEVWGFFGVVAVIFVAIVVTLRFKFLGWLFIIPLGLMIVEYIQLAQTTPIFAWRAVLLAIGAFLVFIMPVIQVSEG